MMDREYESEYFDIEDTHWWFKARRHLLKQTLPQDVGRVLEVGSGSGCNLACMSATEKVGFDISEEASHRAKLRGVKVITGDLQKGLPFEKESFDAVLALDVLEHLTDDGYALGELIRVLKPQGTIVLSVPAFQQLWSYHDTLNHHYRRYSKKNVQELCKTYNLKTETLTYWNCLLFIVIYFYKKFGTNPNGGYTGLRQVPRFLNFGLYSLLVLENWSISRGVKLPWGVSVFYVGKK